MLATIVHINFTLSFLSHEHGCHSFHCCYASYLLLQNIHMLNLNYAFEFRSQVSRVFVPVLCSYPGTSL